jgi:hypothetical protein
MNSIWDLISALIAPLLGDLIDHKITGKKIQWSRIFRLCGVGFSAVGIIIAILFAADKDVDLSGA